jgi:hypothetical protein
MNLIESREEGIQDALATFKVAKVRVRHADGIECEHDDEKHTTKCKKTRTPMIKTRSWGPSNVLKMMPTPADRVLLNSPPAGGEKAAGIGDFLSPIPSAIPLVGPGMAGMTTGFVDDSARSGLGTTAGAGLGQILGLLAGLNLGPKLKGFNVDRIKSKLLSAGAGTMAGGLLGGELGHLVTKPKKD